MKLLVLHSFAVCLVNLAIFALFPFEKINATTTNESRAVKWQRSHSLAAEVNADQTGRHFHFDDDQPQPLCLLEHDRSAIYLTIPENAKKGTILGTMPIIGSSGGQKPTIKLSIVKGREFVRLNALTKQLMLRKKIDREQKGMEQLEAIFKCTPLAPMPFHSDIFPLNISVFITVTDLNDNAPQFGAGGHFSVQIPEELPEGTPIKLEFRATDLDKIGPNSRIRYRILRSPPVQETKDEEQQQTQREWSNENTASSAQSAAGDRTPFEVFYTDFYDDCAALLNIPDPFRPELFVAGRIDFEKMPNFTVFIEAEDQGTPKLRTFARLDVKVIDVDDLNPTFGSQMYKSGEHKGFTLVVEPTPIRAWDADQSFDEPIIYSLSGDHSLNYAIDQLTGEVKLLAEQLVRANLIVQARQANRPERNATAFLLVHPPAVEEKAKGEQTESKSIETIILKFPSNTAIGTKLIRLVNENGTTPGGAGGDEEALALEIIVPKSQRRNLPFFIDQKTKWLRLGRRMAIGQYDANISIKLSGPKRQPTIRSLNIRLTVIGPIGGHLAFEKQIYEFELAPKGENGGETPVEIGQIRAKHMETWRNGTTAAGQAEEEEGKKGDQLLITYALLNRKDLFDIHPTDGVLRLQRDPSAELRPPFELVVVAENSNGARDFARCIVRLESKLGNRRDGFLPPSLVAPDAALCLGLLSFLLLLTNCATLSLWLGKRRSANWYEQLAAYRYDSMGLAGAKQQQQSANINNGTRNNSLDWVMNKALEGDGAVTIANWVDTNRNNGGGGCSRTTWRTSSTATEEEGEE